MAENCPTCNSTMKFAGFVSFPKKTIHFCAACDNHHWFNTDPASEMTAQQQQQPQAKPDEQG